MRTLVALLCGIFLVPGIATAQAPDPVQDQIKKLEERVRVLEAEVQSLKGAQAATPPVAQPSESIMATPPAASQAPITAPSPGGTQLPVYGGPRALGKSFNPDIGGDRKIFRGDRRQR